MSSLRKPDLLSLNDYLDGELHSELRHEFVDGRVYAMAGASERHNRIAGNVFFRLRSRSGGGPCGVYISDMKIRVDAANVCYYPDVALVCEPDDDDPYLKRKPCLIAEVLSPTTEATDRREKWAVYESIPSLRYYLLIASEQRRVEYFARVPGGEWEIATLDGDEVLTVSCPGYGGLLTLDEIYEDVVFAV
ncbi:MAG: Uma2 family endonuclease [Chromatiales bacterium]|nr:Uma2 family endonuclease [Chromatiales bacterium]